MSKRAIIAASILVVILGVFLFMFVIIRQRQLTLEEQGPPTDVGDGERTELIAPPQPDTTTTSTLDRAPAPPPTSLFLVPFEKLIDTDKDGLPDLEENQYHSDVTKPDTDGDGLSDSLEVRDYCTDPTNAKTHGVPDSEWVASKSSGDKRRSEPFCVK